MLKVSLLLLMMFAQTPPQNPPPADMARKMESACTTCHGPSLIAQQRLDRNGWTREIDKMTRWGAAVQPADRDALINYLARQFNNTRPLPNSAQAVPPGPGSDLFQTYCLGCHNGSPVMARKLDKTGWTGIVDQMMKWGAYIPSGRKDELVEYLANHWGK